MAGISGNRVRQAREICGYTQAQLASLVGVEQATISYIELEYRQPSPELLNSLAFRTGFPPSFFSREAGPEFALGSLLFRRRESLDSTTRDGLRQMARAAFEVFEMMAQRCGSFDVRVPRLSESEPAEAAALCRSAMGLSPDTPITHLINKLERAGVVVVALPSRVEHADAFSVWAGNDVLKPLVALVGGWPGDRQRFTLAHELAHLVLHQDLRRSPGTLDSEADVFAAEFLLPAAAMMQEFSEALTLTRLAELKGRWGVSMQVLARRAEHLGAITLAQRKYIDKQLVAKGWIRNEPVEIKPEKPRLFRKMAEQLFGTPPDVARLCQVTGPTSSKFVSELLAEHAEAPIQVSSQLPKDDHPNLGQRKNVLSFRQK